MEGDEEEEYAIEGPPQAKRLGLGDTPEGMQRRRARAYHDRVDPKGRCLYVTCCLWSWAFFAEDFLRACLIVGCGVVAEYFALKRGKSFDQAVGEGWGFGILSYVLLFMLRRLGYSCVDKQTTRRGVRDETSPCFILSFVIIVVLLITVLAIFGTVHEYCVEGVSCTLPTDWIFTNSSGGGDAADDLDLND